MNLCAQTDRCRKLIVDTDLGLDDLVALAILRVQQCLLERRSLPSHEINADQRHHHTNFRICGVTIQEGISHANVQNAELLRRLLPPDTPVFVSGADKKFAWMNGATGKPAWWTRTAGTVKQFLTSLPETAAQIQSKAMAAEEYLANNFNDADVDILCMAPLTTVSKALDLYTQQYIGKSINSNFYIMGGIRNDSKWTKRGESTAPFGYHDIFSGVAWNVSTEQNSTTKADQFGEFNFALDIESARRVLASVPAHIITLEACTLVPPHLRGGMKSTTLSSILATNTVYLSDGADELDVSRNNLLKLLLEFGTNETQWDSISAAIYCGIFQASSAYRLPVRLSEFVVSDLGVCEFPGQCVSADVSSNLAVWRNYDNINLQNEINQCHRVHPAFSSNDEQAFFIFLSSILTRLREVEL
jgi:inosine-uridine nucleoside N-ribohydrolase